MYPQLQDWTMVSFHKFWLWSTFKNFDVISFIRFEGLSIFSHLKVWGRPIFLVPCIFRKFIGFNNLWIHSIFKESCWYLSKTPSPLFQIWGTERGARKVLYFVGPEEIVSCFFIYFLDKFWNSICLTYVP